MIETGLPGISVSIPEEGTHNPGWPNGLIVVIITIIPGLDVIHYVLLVSRIHVSIHMS
jgi:hypothetical protein